MKKKKKQETKSDRLPRPIELPGKTLERITGCGKIYITLNYAEGKLFEVFANMGKAGGCASSQTEAIGRLVSLALRHGIEPDSVIKQLQGISCHLPCGIGPNRISSCADAVAATMRHVLGIKRPKNVGPVGGPEFDPEDTKQKTQPEPVTVDSTGACPECGSPVIHSSGCEECSSRCGWTRCG